MEELSLHILDIAENSIRAGAKNIEIVVEEEPQNDRLTIAIRDDGAGMDEAHWRGALDPFFTTKAGKRVGLGLPLLAEAARRAGGRLRVRSEPGRGTEVRAVFRHRHIDRQPLGDVAETIRMLVIGSPEIGLTYTHRAPGREFRFAREHLDGPVGAWEAASPQGLRRLTEALRGDFGEGNAVPRP